tara:strand:- start:1391 stop:1780 length:390 start_codon:yes stop_codon:yes gene_type:complete
MAKNKLSEQINSACGNLKGDKKKKCVNHVRNRINMDAEREQSYADIDRLYRERDEKIQKYGAGFIKAIKHVNDKKAVLEQAQELYERKQGLWDTKGRERTLEDYLFDERSDANWKAKMRKAEEKSRWHK